MRYLTYIFVLLISVESIAKELITTSHATSKIEKFTLPNGTVYSNYKNIGTWTDNFGNYGKTMCFGLIETNDLGGIKLDLICENIDKEGYKSWIILKRNSLQFDSGVGLTEYIDGTGPWVEVIGTKCTYATTYLKEVSFTIDKCKITEKAYNALSGNN